MSNLSADESTKKISVRGWETRISDERSIFVGYNEADAEDKSFFVSLKNGEFKNYLRLSEDAGLALLASLETAVEHRKAGGDMRRMAFKVIADLADAAKLPPGQWQLVTEGDK